MKLWVAFSLAAAVPCSVMGFSAPQQPKPAARWTQSSSSSSSLSLSTATEAVPFAKGPR